MRLGKLVSVSLCVEILRHIATCYLMFCAQQLGMLYNEPVGCGRAFHQLFHILKKERAFLDKLVGRTDLARIIADLDS